MRRGNRTFPQQVSERNPWSTILEHEGVGRLFHSLPSNGLAHAVVSEGASWTRSSSPSAATRRSLRLGANSSCARRNSPEAVADYTGVPAELIRKAARAYATAGNLGRMGIGINPLRGQNSTFSHRT